MMELFKITGSRAAASALLKASRTPGGGGGITPLIVLDASLPIQTEDGLNAVEDSEYEEVSVLEALLNQHTPPA